MTEISLKRTPVVQREQPIANGSSMEAQFKNFADPSAVIHHGQHRAPKRKFELIESGRWSRSRHEKGYGCGRSSAEGRPSRCGWGVGTGERAGECKNGRGLTRPALTISLLIEADFLDQEVQESAHACRQMTSVTQEHSMHFFNLSRVEILQYGA
jgi:hypothetical protein